MYAAKLANIHLSPFSAICKQEGDFTLHILNIVADKFSSSIAVIPTQLTLDAECASQVHDPTAPIPKSLLKPVYQAPHMLYALAASPEIQLNLRNDAHLTGKGGKADIVLIFQSLIERIVLCLCHDKPLCRSSHDQGVEYLTQHPRELRIAHREYRIERVQDLRAKAAKDEGKQEASEGAKIQPKINSPISDDGVELIDVRLSMADEGDEELKKWWVENLMKSLKRK